MLANSPYPVTASPPALLLTAAALAGPAASLLLLPLPGALGWDPMNAACRDSNCTVHRQGHVSDGRVAL